MTRPFHVCLVVIALWSSARPAAAAGQVGQVAVGGVPVPGATVTAMQGERRAVATTDEDGVYRFVDLPEGIWTITVEMRGFATLVREVTVANGAPPQTWELSFVPFDELAGNLPVREPSPVPSDGVASAPSSFRRAEVTPAPAAPAQEPAGSPDEPPIDSTGMGAANSLLINGSVNNGGATPFAQLAAFGNNRLGPRWLYTGGVGVLLGNSAWDARPYSFSGARTPKPDYHDAQLLGTFGGPLRIPGLLESGGQFMVGYQRSLDNIATTAPARLPTALERAGDFSQTTDAFGRPVAIVDPLTGTPFPASRIPAGRISPQAAALAGYYPLPNMGTGGYNFQAPVVTATRQDNVQSRLQRQIAPRSGIAASFGYSRTAAESTSLLGFDDVRNGRGLEAEATVTHRFSQFFTLRTRYRFARQTNETTPHFANRANVSGDAGIAGNDQTPVNWGPPTLAFASGIEPLADVPYAFSRTQSHGLTVETFLARGRHALTVGGGIRRNGLDIHAQQDARGTFTFTGAATGFDFADFLLGIPQTSAIAFGNPDKFFRGNTYELYFSDDWRISPGLTVNAGVRWEYEVPLTERLGRLVNLDVAPGFTAAHPVVAARAEPGLSGVQYPESLLFPDRRGVQPRVGVAWRPVPGSSLVVRAGYGIYRNTNVYGPIATFLAQQPPLSTSFSVHNGSAHAFTLADGFLAPAGAAPNTFAVDPRFRVGYAHDWQASVQRDLPGSLTVLATYLGTKGSHLMQQVLPNTYPPGMTNPCPSCPAGFVYLTSNGSSSRHAGQLQLRRRLRNGLTATVQYTVSKAEDNAAAFLGASLKGSAIAQDWLDVDAEWAPSNFDQRHHTRVELQYTTGMSVTGGALMSGLAGRLLRGWTVTAQLTAGSGLPFTPLVLVPVPGTGVTGTIRASVIGAGAGSPPDGAYADPASYGAPAPGTWGTARRNSIVGPAQFDLNAGIRRTFPWGDRLNLEWGLDATNVLNRVTYAGVNALAGSPQFGLPNSTNGMRKIQSVLRLRF